MIFKLENRYFENDVARFRCLCSIAKGRQKLEPIRASVDITREVTQLIWPHSDRYDTKTGAEDRNTAHPYSGVQLYFIIVNK